MNKHSTAAAPPTPTFAADLRAAHAPIYRIIALLQGAEALLEKAESLPDPDGDVWSATELVRHTLMEAQGMMAGFDTLHLIQRAEQIEGVAA
jgi:hypothetical protein